MAYTVENAQPEDIDELAKAIISGLPPQLLKIQGADKNAEKLVAAVSRGLESSIANPNHLVIVAREQGTGTAVSLADWVLPAEDMKVPKTEEEMKEEIEKRRKALPPGRNEAFMVDNLTQMLTMTRIALNGRRCYHLASLVTLEAYRGKGLATKLVQWPLKQADNEGEIAFLTTDDIGPARKIYERAGFLVAGEINLDFEKYGSSGSLKRVGMLREPRRAESVRLVVMSWVNIRTEHMRHWRDRTDSRLLGSYYMARNEYEFTPLNASATWGHLNTLLVLLRYGADPSVPSCDGQSTMFGAAKIRQAWAQQAYAFVGADMNLPADNRWTPLHSAVDGNHVETAVALLSAGAQLHVKDKKRRTPIGIATSRGFRELERVLMEQSFQ